MGYTMSEQHPQVETASSPSNTEGLSSDRTSGCVKWFNNKAGYGFITVTSGEHRDSDVFVHHSAIIVSTEQYRYLVQGEYVTFELCRVDNAKHKWQAGMVHGINDGKLMCETRLESRQTRNTNKDMGEKRSGQSSGSQSRENNELKNEQQYEQRLRMRARGMGPRDGDEW